MKIKLNNSIKIDNLSSDKDYEVITIIYVKWEKLNMTYNILYYVINDIYGITCLNDSDCIITDSALDSDYIYKEYPFGIQYTAFNNRIRSYALHPKCVDVSNLYSALEYTEPIVMDKSYCERFKHIIPEYIYAKFFKEIYQDPNINIIAEKAGNSWVMCPECYETFIVDKKQGVIVCPNIVCKICMNNPYSKIYPTINKQETI